MSQRRGRRVVAWDLCARLQTASIPDDLLCSDVLIIGSMIAGATSALELADAGVPVTLFTRGESPTTDTYIARAVTSM